MSKQQSKEQSEYSEALHKSKQRFSQESPLKTLIKFSIAPTIAEALEMIYSIANSIYLGNTDKDSLAGLAAAEPFENVCPTLGWLFQCGLSSHVSRLISQGETKRVKYISLISFALAIASSAILAGFLLGFLKPIMNFLNIEEGHIGDEAENYIRPMLYAAPLTVLYYCQSGLAYGLGHIKLYTTLSVIPMIIGVAVTSPIFIIGLRMKCLGAGISCVLSYGIPCIVYLVYFTFFDKLIRPFSWGKIQLDGEFTVKQLLKDAVEVIEIGASEFAALFAWIITIAVGYMCLSNLGQAMGMNSEISEVWGVISRLRTFIMAFAVGLNSGCLATSSYAQGNKDIKRYLELQKLNYICCFVSCGFFAVFLQAIPEYLLMAFGIHEEKSLELGAMMFRCAGAGVFIMYVELCTQTLFQSIEFTTRAFIMAAIVFFIYPGFFLIMYYSLEQQLIHDPEKHIYLLMAGWSFGDVTCTVLALSFAAFSLKGLKKQVRLMKPDDETQKLMDDPDDQSKVIDSK